MVALPTRWLRDRQVPASVLVDDAEFGDDGRGGDRGKPQGFDRPDRRIDDGCLRRPWIGRSPVINLVVRNPLAVLAVEEQLLNRGSVTVNKAVL